MLVSPLLFFVTVVEMATQKIRHKEAIKSILKDSAIKGDLFYCNMQMT